MFAFPSATHSHSPFGHSHRAQHPHAYSPFGSASYGYPSSSRHASVDPYLAQEVAEREALRELQHERRRSIELARRRQQQQEEEEEQARQEFAYRQYVKQQLAREQAQKEEEERYRRAVVELQREQRAREERQARQHFIAQQQRQQQIAHARAHAQTQAQQQKQRQIEAQQQQGDSDDLNDFLMANPLFQFLSQLSGQQQSAPAQERHAQQPTPAPTRAAEPAPAPAPVAPFNPSPPTDALESAATTLQTAYRQRLARRANLDKLAALTAELATAEAAFELPSTLDFDSRNPVKLAFTPHNAPFLAFEDSLVKLLTRVDEVVSGGDREVKKARKALVGKIEQQLARLDKHKEALAKEAVVESVNEKEVESTETTPAAAEQSAIETDTAAEDTPAPATQQTDDAPTPTDTTTQSTEPPAAEEDVHSDCETESTLSVDSIDAWDVVDDLIKQTVSAAEEQSGPTKDPKPLAAVQERDDEEEDGVLEDLFAQ